MTRRTDAEVMKLIREGGNLDKARAQFSFGCARIEQAGQQRTPLGPIELRRMEFEAVEKIIAAYNGEKV